MFGTKSISKKQFILGLYLVLFALVGPAIFVLLNNNQQGRQNEAVRHLSLGSLFKIKFDFNQSHPVQQRMSLGSSVLLTADNFPEKQAAVQAFAVGDYPTAIRQFRTSLKHYPNDPESWIYLNNAIAASNPQAVKVAVSVPIGGNLDIAREILRGVAQLQTEVNQSEVAVNQSTVNQSAVNQGAVNQGAVNQGERKTGQPIQVLIVNDDNNPAIARKIASDLVRDHSIIAVIGHNSTETTLAAAPLYQQGKLVMISPTSAGQKLSGLGKYIFRTTPSVRVTAATLSQYVTVSDHKSKVAICAASKSEVSQSFKDEFIWNLAQVGKDVSDLSCDFSDPKFKADDIPSQAVANGADALLIVPSVETMHQAMDVIRANRRRLPLFGNQTLYTAETLKSGQVDVSGMILPVPWDPEASPNHSFATNAQKLWGIPASWRTAMAYDATLVITQALKFGATREQLQKTLQNPGFSVTGATGVIRFLPTGDRSMKGVLVQVEPRESPDPGYDFVALQPEPPPIGGGYLP